MQLDKTLRIFSIFPEVCLQKHPQNMSRESQNRTFF